MTSVIENETSFETTCILSDVLQSSEVTQSQRHLRALWPVALLVCAIGGWQFGHQLKASHAANADVQHASRTAATSAREAPQVGFVAGSPRALWMERVKVAKASDFTKLLEEWEVVFALDGQYVDDVSPRAIAALRWMMGMWLIKDIDGFLQMATNEKCYHMERAAHAMVELMPEKTAAWILDSQRQDSDQYFISYLMVELAHLRPALYLQLNPGGTSIDTPHGNSLDTWMDAIARLAESDAVAAGGACLRWKAENDSRGLLEALTSVVTAWKPSDPPIADWVHSITDQNIRGIANLALLYGLAEKDPNAAMKAVSAMKWDNDNHLSRELPCKIWIHLAWADPLAALKLMKESENYLPYDRADPFGEPSPQKEPKNVQEMFFNLSGTSEIRDAVLNALAGSLPRDPAELFVEMRKLTAGLGGDEAWQRGIEAHLIQEISVNWSAEECLEAAESWAIESNSKEVEVTLEKLAIQAAKSDPDNALTHLQRFPKSARPFLLREIIKRLPSSDTAGRIELLQQLPTAHWDRELGESLGGNANEYASFVAESPVKNSSEVLGAFTRKWGEENPEAAADWLDSLQDASAKSAAAEGLASEWIIYDADAATAWANSLADGTVRDAAAQRISYWFSMGKSADAWKWADTITDPQKRAEAYGQVAIYWRKNVPDEFRAAHDKARQTAGLPAYIPETNHLENPFE